MNTLTLLTALTALAALAAFALARHRRRRESVTLCNIAEVRHIDGIIGNWTADAAHTLRYLVVKRGATAISTAICGAADVPIGISQDQPEIGVAHAVRVFSARGTTFVVASAAIAQDALVEPAANGKVAALGAGAGTHHVLGRALTAAAADGDLVELDVAYFLRVI